MTQKQSIQGKSQPIKIPFTKQEELLQQREQKELSNGKEASQSRQFAFDVRLAKAGFVPKGHQWAGMDGFQPITAGTAGLKRSAPSADLTGLANITKTGQSCSAEEQELVFGTPEGDFTSAVLGQRNNSSTQTR